MTNAKKEGKPAPTKAERQEALFARDEIPVTRREERLALSLEGQLEAATEGWED